MFDQDEAILTHENDDTLHVVFPCLDQGLVVALGLLYIDRPEFGRPFVILVGVAVMGIGRSNTTIVERLGIPRTRKFLVCV